MNNSIVTWDEDGGFLHFYGPDKLGYSAQPVIYWGA